MRDYSLTESPSLAQASGYERGCRTLATPTTGYDEAAYNEHYYLEDGEEPPPGFKVDTSYRPYVALADYIKHADVKVIPASEIRPEWRTRRATSRRLRLAGGGVSP